jgi:hypothetical protein
VSRRALTTSMWVVCELRTDAGFQAGELHDAGEKQQKDVSSLSSAVFEGCVLLSNPGGSAGKISDVMTLYCNWLGEKDLAAAGRGCRRKPPSWRWSWVELGGARPRFLLDRQRPEGNIKRASTVDGRHPIVQTAHPDRPVPPTVHPSPTPVFALPPSDVDPVVDLASPSGPSLDFIMYAYHPLLCHAMS